MYLAKYLAAEAKDKLDVRAKQRNRPASKGVIVCSLPLPVRDSDLAQVPTQPNYCDCGLYLIHFAEMFTENTALYVEAILVCAIHVRRCSADVT